MCVDPDSSFLDVSVVESTVQGWYVRAPLRAFVELLKVSAILFRVRTKKSMGKYFAVSPSNLLVNLRYTLQISIAIYQVPVNVRSYCVLVPIYLPR